MDPRIAQILRSRGAPTDGFTTRRLTREHIADTDLVLTATRVERDHVVAMHPEALRRTFTLTELARLAPHVGPIHRCGPFDAAVRRRVVAAALALRGHTGYVDPATDDIPDPAANPKRFATSAEHIWLALQAVVDALRATPNLGDRGGP
jgi:protein-tyrosine phosphatase